MFFWVLFFPNLLLFGLSVIAGRSGSNMKSGTASWPMDWQECHLRRLGRTSLNVSCGRGSFVVFFIFVLIKLISLLGKNFAEDTADFGNDSLASRRHFGIGREECFQICICLLWPHAFRTQDLKHALSTAYLVKHATPRPWCICVDSRDSLTNTFETREFWTYRSESFMGVVSNRRRRRCR